MKRNIMVFALKKFFSLLSVSLLFPALAAMMEKRVQSDTANLPLYCAIDLSSGSTSMNYRVTWTNAVPPNGWSLRDKTEQLVLRRIDPGSFRFRGKYPVRITRTFYMAIFETTCRQFELVMGRKVYRDTKSADEPMGFVRWDDVRGVTDSKCEDQRLFDRYDWPTSRIVSNDSFAGRLSARTGLKFDLPTEAQWEYACRAGTTTLYNNNSNSPYGLFKYANFGSNGKFGWENHGPILHVGAFLPNRWGLYDMHGNRDEWCLDHASNDPPPRRDDPVGPEKRESEDGCWRVLRGGNRRDHPEDCTSIAWRSAWRYGEDLDEDWFAGFRIVFTATPSSREFPQISGVKKTSKK